jgi:uncharacterized protein (DUF305 family)
MRTRRLFAAVALSAAATAGCSSHDAGHDASASSPSIASSADLSATASGAAASAADVAFAQSMIPHHEQAVEMADLALADSAGASPSVVALAEQIKKAQDPEIEQMTGWLQQWGAPVTMPGTDGSDMADMDHGDHDMGGITMSGMVSAEDMQALREASGQDFDILWMRAMIAHHEGAVVMAEQVKESTDKPEVEKLADEVIRTQTKEIQTMQAYLAP